jgi:2-amino-1-hydroxyethylphosphonate dioxygenase (glycine-forming)
MISKYAQISDEVLMLYQRFGNENCVGKPVTQIEHMCQCAQLAEAGGFDNEVILAAFFHDIGHLVTYIIPGGQMDRYGEVDHEKMGAAYLREKGFSEKITQLVAAHVPAKRYLVYKYPEYYDQLSGVSKKTLKFQGGAMSKEEAENFEADELYPLYIQLRKWDEQAKLEHVALPSLDHYRKMMIGHLMEQGNIMSDV